MTSSVQQAQDRLITHYVDDAVTIYHGDCVDVLLALPDCSADSIVTDPPYELTSGKKGGTGVASVNLDSPYGRSRIGTGNGSGGFMGKQWDATGIAHSVEFWADCLRVLKPGGHLLAFGGSRTWHRLAVAVEDAGFELRDSIAWLYGSGFPKSLNLVTETGERTGWGTALKPAFEPIIVARKPLAGTVAANVQQYGTGALNIDACRVGSSDSTGRPRGTFPHSDDAWGNGRPDEVSSTHPAGRWPANVVLDESQAAELDKQSAGTRSSKPSGTGSVMASGMFGIGGERNSTAGQADTGGGASRFFYVAKAPTSQRPKDEDGSAHPTVKPLDLMRWLCRLVTPPGGVVLEPFAGSGATVEACLLEGFRCIAVEREAAYLPLILQRISKPLQPGIDFAASDSAAGGVA